MAATAARLAMPNEAGVKAEAPLVLLLLVIEMVGDVKARVVACVLGEPCVPVDL